MDELSQFKETYITECFELLEEMEEKLLSFDVDAPDVETLHAIFRCAHSIKGGAGAFGFSQITNFTHIAEYLLDALREGKLTPTREMIDDLLKSVDVIMQMVRAAQSDEVLADDFGKDLCDTLEAYVEGSDGTVPSAASDDSTHDITASENTGGETHFYTIRFLPHEHLFKTGNEPLLIIRELKTLGDVTVTVDMEKLPPLESLDPEICYLSWQIELESDKPRSMVEEVFEFVEDACDLEIEELAGLSLPPRPAESDEEASSVSNEDSAAAPVDTQPSSHNAPAAETTKTAQPTPAKAPQEAQPTAAKSMPTTSIRVDLDKIDKLVNLVGELVITQAMLQAQTRELQIDQYPALLSGVGELSQHTRELQEAVMSVRMQPVKSIFSRMPRIVRDLSGKLNKEIKLEMEGENTEVDKTVIEQLGDPLTHMIRNAVDHGIEQPEVRVAAGKPAEGTIILSASHRGGRIVIEISDDGGGINRERVLSIAQSKGLVPEHHQLDDFEIDNLVFMPGFSTAEEVTDISGRGVGMDVVKRNIEALGGTVHIRSRPGKGSRFVVSLPLTLAILDGMIVRVGEEHFIIPIANIIETTRPAKDDVRKIADGNDLIDFRGEYVSLLYLHEQFGCRNAIHEAYDALVVLAESGEDKLGLVVDELIGQQQVVIKSLEANADPVGGISGATILGDGKVSLILDITQLQRMNHQGRDGRSMLDKEAVAA